jgi:hypothetical protein
MTPEAQRGPSSLLHEVSGDEPSSVEFYSRLRCEAASFRAVRQEKDRLDGEDMEVLVRTTWKWDRTVLLLTFQTYSCKLNVILKPGC